MYELYVYAHTVRCIVKHLNAKPKYLGRLSIGIDATRLYFNRYPKKLSRIITHITKGKTPRPDILAIVDGRSIVIDAKYRRFDSEKPRLLRLSDAERIAAYMLDACKDTVFRAIIAGLSKPPQQLLERIISKAITLNGKRMRVDFVEVNPDMEPEGVDDIANYLLQS